MENSKTSNHGWYKSLFKKVEKVSKLIFDDEMTKPKPRITKQIGVDVWGNNLRVVPKHIFEKQDDPLKFKHYPPVVTGQYTLKDADPIESLTSLAELGEYGIIFVKDQQSNSKKFGSPVTLSFKNETFVAKKQLFIYFIISAVSKFGFITGVDFPNLL